MSFFSRFNRKSDKSSDALPARPPSTGSMCFFLLDRRHHHLTLLPDDLHGKYVSGWAREPRRVIHVCQIGYEQYAEHRLGCPKVCYLRFSA